MKIRLPKMGIDPGVSNGGISILKQTNTGSELKSHKMVESFRDIKEILKPYGGSSHDTEVRCSIEKLSMRPGQSSFITARMQPMLRNFDRLKDALTDLYIPFQEVSPATWQKFHNLVLPKGVGEKGIDYETLLRLKKDAKQIPLHTAIERNTLNDVVITEKVKYILETSGKNEARKALKDEFYQLNKYQLNTTLKEVEKQIEKIKTHEKRIRKKRYQALAEKYVNRKVPLWESDSILLLIYQKYNPCPTDN